MSTLWLLVVANLLYFPFYWRFWRQYDMYRPRTLWREMQRVQNEDERGGRA